MQTSVPEAMVIADGMGVKALKSFDAPTEFDSLGVGPGLGISNESEQFLSKLLKSKPSKLVLDADAINIIAKNTDLLNLIHENTILTPHPGEFTRLVCITKRF